MKHFLSVDDVADPMALAREAMNLKSHPLVYDDLGRRKVLGLIFLNPSLRTRMSTTRAAYNLSMNVMALNMSHDSWTLETEDGVVMDGDSIEHVKDAAAVMGQYCEIIGIRSFPSLKDREEDYGEHLIKYFAKYSGVPVVNLESSTVHPLQSLADLVTIEELKKTKKPKVVMTWAPHVRALPQSVPNSFAEWMNRTDYDFTIAHPEGLELASKFVGNAEVVHDQQAALEGADFVYVKNWSGYEHYAELVSDRSWMVTLEKLKKTNNARLMHCLPVRRNVVISDDALDSQHSVILKQAANRVCAAQAVLKTILMSS
ncbi:MAG: acetylornithine carbamoyltransferase [Cyclobacteriaceae bacterium]